ESTRPASAPNNDSITTSKMSASTTVFSIPELTENIVHFVNTTSDRLHLSMTNRLLRLITTPLLWSSLELHSEQQTQRLLKSPETYCLFQRHIRSIQELKVQAGALVPLIQSMTQSQDYQMTGLINLEYKANQDQDQDQDEDDHQQQQQQRHPHRRRPYEPNRENDILPRLGWLFHHNASLTRISMAGIHIQSITYLNSFGPQLLNLKSLKEFDFHFSIPVEVDVGRWAAIVHVFFLSLPQSLESVTFRIRIIEGPKLWRDPGEAPSPLLEYISKRKGPLDRLKTLRILYWGQKLNVDSSLLYWFLQQCPSLETFHPPTIGRDDDAAARRYSTIIAETAATYCPRLRKLESCGMLTLDILAKIPEHTFQAIHDREKDLHQGFALNAVQERHFRSIKEIRMENCASHIRGPVIRSILSTCLELEHLTIKGPAHPSVRLKYLVEKEWVCLKLRVLEITVDMRQGIYPAVLLSRMPAVYKPTWTMLKTFYRQLGSLSEIEVLNLGIMSKEMEWLDENGQERIAVRAQPSQQGEGDDDWTLEGYPDTFHADWMKLNINRAGASFPGLLSLGDELMDRPGYLTWLGGLTKLRELRGNVQVTTSETIKTVGQKELGWMLEHWPRLKVIELLPRVPKLIAQNLVHPANISPSHIVWFQQERPDIVIRQD
ncbi:hypothetical protein BGZ96_002677, partial [Linnemannia gamsii]